MSEASTFLWKITKLKYYFLTIYSDLLSKSLNIQLECFNFVIFHKNVLASDNIIYALFDFKSTFCSCDIYIFVTDWTINNCKTRIALHLTSKDNQAINLVS